MRTPNDARYIYMGAPTAFHGVVMGLSPAMEAAALPWPCHGVSSHYHRGHGSPMGASCQFIDTPWRCGGTAKALTWTFVYGTAVVRFRDRAMSFHGSSTTVPRQPYGSHMTTASTPRQCRSSASTAMGLHGAAIWYRQGVSWHCHRLSWRRSRTAMGFHGNPMATHDNPIPVQALS